MPQNHIGKLTNNRNAITEVSPGRMTVGRLHGATRSTRPTVGSPLTVTSRSDSCLFLSFMPTKDLAPFSYIPHKNPLL